MVPTHVSDLPFPMLVCSLAGWPDVTLLRAAARSRATAVLNLDALTPDDAQSSFAALARQKPGRIGVRVSAGTEIDSWPPHLVDAIDVIVVAGPGIADVVRRFGEGERQILAECLTLDDARAAAALSVGVIAKGHESGGRVGEETTFVLVQRFVAELPVPVWAQGGIGTHTIGACAIAGCAGVVLDAQLSLARESTLPDSAKAAITRMAGDETTCIGSELNEQYRVLGKADRRVVEELRNLEAALVTQRDRGEIDGNRWREAVLARVSWRTGADTLWLMGQDAAFAAPLAEKHRSVSGIVEGLRQAMDRHLEDARRCSAIDRGAPLAAAHGTEYPILQGPMTRVSDTAGFARAVADAGGLPFLACALLRGPQLRTLLDETKAQLQNRAWGVGILGFVPLELREEQLRVIEDVSPPFALIAGGRPDQAVTLERKGIATYLHVPAPGLLRMFVADGARRFIFEGRECGGHVGPRTSFVLWETLVDVLLTAIAGGVRAEELSVVFAGGIHDARSAAMAAVIGAPLSALGVRLGVLMGTAYLFTAEAVETGTIVEGFQQEALGCARTVLLETGPGHSTRCAETPFVRTFQETRRGLVAKGAAPDDIRIELERLNLGRLRVASKGITRRDEQAEAAASHDGTPYVHVADADQHREGMYMIGQVAALRASVCRMAELHHDVSAGGAALLRETAATPPSRAVPQRQTASALSSRVAIIGLGCILPKAPDVRTLWSNLLNKVDAIGEIPADRFDAGRYYDADRHAPDKIYSKWGGFLDEIPFDPMKYGIPPSSLPSIDPFQLLTLEAVHQALADAGYAEREFDRERTSVILGASGGVGDLGFRYGIRAGLPMYLDHVPEQTLARLPQWTEDSFAGVLLNVAAGRVANRLNLGGLNFTVDAACASSLAAVYVAARELEAGSSNMAIVGGIDTVNSPFGFLCFSSAQALSPTGRCRTFDETADGIAISEGLVVLVLKRLEDAERDGDRVYAVIRSVAGSSDGRGKGLTAPRPEGQMRVLERAYEAAGFSPSTVGLVEAHGTGTVAGDSAEVAALSQVFSAGGTAPASCALGSIKSMIGHTKSAAGVTGLMKVALALHHKVLPPTIHVTNPNRKLREDDSPFFVNTEAQPWVAPASEPRRAAVSSFGFGGTNFHVVLEEFSADGPGTLPAQSPTASWPAELAAWSGASSEELLASLGQAEQLMSRAPAIPLRDVAAATCRTCQPASAHPVRLAIVASSIADLREKIAAAREALQSGRTSLTQHDRGIYLGRHEGPAGKVAFVFPGQGSQYPGMLRETALHFPDLRRALELADGATACRYSRQLSAYILPPPAFSTQQRERQARELTDTVVAQPALGAVEIGLCRLIERLNIRPDMTAGHSYGEWVALCAAGAFSPETLFALSETRGRLIKAAAGDAGTMAAVGATPDAINSVIGQTDDLWIANVNSPRQTVLAGRTAAIEAAVATLAAAGLPARRIPVACAFHSPLVESAGRQLQEVLSKTSIGGLRIPVFSNASAAPYPEDPDRLRGILSEHLASPVRFAEEVQAMYAQGARIFIEVGPRSVLSNLIRETLASSEAVIVPLDQPDRGGVTQLLSAVAQLIAAGLSIDFEELWRGRAIRPTTLARLEPAPATPNHVWMVNGSRARPQNPPAQKPSAAPQRQERKNQAPTPPGPITKGELMADESPDVMQQFQHLMSQFLQTQALVMTTYLQGAPAALAGPALTPSMPVQRRPVAAIEPAVSIQPANGNGHGPGNGSGNGHGNGNANGHAHASAPAVPPPNVVMPPPAVERRDLRPVQASQTMSAASVLAQLIRLASDRTGYPEEMLDADSNIEADLGIDSIKRMEILAAFRELHTTSDSGAFQGAMERLTALKTLRETATTLAAVLDGTAEAVA